MVDRERIEHNLARVRERIADAAARGGRNAKAIRLIAVTKGQPLQAVRVALELGLRDLGENRVEEALPKIEALGPQASIRWHMIGHLQSRKASKVPGQFVMVHSVDREKIARRLDRFAGERGLTLPVLLECNVSGEATKYGWPAWEEARWPELVPIFASILQLPNLKVEGLMTMAPWVDDERILRQVFGRLRALGEYLEEKLPGHWKELSMGMSDDYPIAVEEGATMLRIGRAIFGAREA
jgi:hypothetical protein